MSLSYSAAASSSKLSGASTSSDAPASPTPSGSTLPPTEASSSSSASQPLSTQHLILDAGPILSLTPLRHLAQTFHTTPMVVAELKDPKARAHFQQLGLGGVDVKIEMPSADAMSKVVAFAKKTGDIAVLSQTDLSVVALTYQYEVMENGEVNVRHEPGQRRKEVVDHLDGSAVAEKETPPAQDEGLAEGGQAEEMGGEMDEVVNQDEERQEPDAAEAGPSSASEPTQPDNGDDEDDGGDWITPSNVQSRRNHDLGLLSANGNGKAPERPLAAACMTGDFAVQNVLLGMGLGLVGEGGKRISKVKSFVLRCHACFKICKDSSKRFCPSCGNATLLRTTITTSATSGQQRIHLKKNFQYHLRGSKYSIPDPKPGRAKGQLKGGSGLILREDQAEWQDAVKSQTIKREKEERKISKGALEGWNDPDWLPEIITVGMSGKGRSGGQGMPTIGHGRKNPNQARRKR